MYLLIRSKRSIAPKFGANSKTFNRTAAALLKSKPNPTEEEVESAMAGNICRCGCYPGIKKAILSVASKEGEKLEVEELNA